MIIFNYAVVLFLLNLECLPSLHRFLLSSFHCTMLFIRTLFSVFLASVVVKSVPLTSDYDTFFGDAGSTSNEFLVSSSTAPEETFFGTGSDIFGPTLDLTAANLDLLSPEVQGLNPLDAFLSDPQINSADSDLFDGAISFNNGLVTPDAGTSSAFTSPEDSIININWDDYAFEPEKNPISSNPNQGPSSQDIPNPPPPPAFPSICSMFNHVNPNEATTITSYKATYGEEGIKDGKILGYSTAWYRGYTGSECGQPTSWYCCLDPVNGDECLSVVDFFPDVVGPDDACQR